MSFPGPGGPKMQRSSSGSRITLRPPFSLLAEEWICVLRPRLQRQRPRRIHTGFRLRHEDTMQKRRPMGEEEVAVEAAGMRSEFP